MTDYFDRRTLGRYPGRVAIASSDSASSIDQAVPTAFYMAGDGTIRPIAMKSGFGFGGSDNFSFSITSPYSDVPINSYPAGYAYASIISVWAARCIEIRSEAVQRIKRSVVDKRTKKPLHNHPFEVALRRAQQHGEAIYSLWEHCKLVFGEVFLWPVQNDFGFYSDLSWLNNLGMNVLTIGGKIGGYSYAPVSGGRMHQFAPGQLAFYKTLNLFNNLRGLSPLDSILLELGIDKDVSRVTKAWYANDARPGVLLIPEVDLSPATAKEFMDYWKENYQGAKNAGKPVLMPSAIKDVKDMQQRPQIDDVEIRESMRREICARFGVPLSIAGAWDDAQYQSSPEQRKSLYEETVIPECEDLDKWFTVSVLPFFDDSGQTEVKSDFADIKALIEDESIKASVSNQRYLAGGISFNEYRRELGKPPIPDDFFVRPQGYTIVPFGEVGKPPPPPVTGENGSATPPSSPFGGGFGTSAEKPSLPTPDAPAQTVGKPEIGGSVSKSNGHRAKTEEDAITDELAAWRKKAMNGGAAKALAFVCYALPKDMESHIRSHLKPDMDKAALKAVFDEAESSLKKTKLDGEITTPPEQISAYWNDFDKLYAEIGSDWLNDYMRNAFESLRPKLRGSIAPEEIMHILAGFRDDLVSQWVGTEQEPGVITQLVQAGMAAGNVALTDGKAPNPVKAEVRLTVDWSLLNHQAYDFAKDYIYNLIRGLDDTTRTDVQNAIAQWVQSGDPLAVLESELEKIFNDAERAASIAQTEATRTYNEGAKQRWQQVGVTRARWQTVNVGLGRTNKQPGDVCPICTELHGQEFDLEQGAWSDMLGQYVQPPVHPRCRCFARPLVADVKLEALPTDVRQGTQMLTPEGYMPLDKGIPGKTVASLNEFLKQSKGQLSKQLQDPELNLLEQDWTTDEYAVNTASVKKAALRFVAESRDIQYGKDYLMNLVQQDLAGKNIEINQDIAEQVYNDFYATRAEAIYTAAQIGDVKLTEAQDRRLRSAMTSSYLDMVYTTETSLEGSLANQTKRKVTYGGNFYASEGARREARREFLDRLGYLDVGGSS